MKNKTDFRQYQKSVEGVLTAFLARPFSRVLTALVADAQWVTPNRLTFCSLLLGLAGCFIWLKGTWVSAVIGTIIFHLGYVFDCSDGELARYRGIKSRFGQALDPIFDRILEFSLIFCATLLVIHDTPDLFWYYIGSWAIVANFLFEYVDLWLNRLYSSNGRFEMKRRFLFLSSNLNLSYREVVLYFLPFTVCIGAPQVSLTVIAVAGTLAFPIQLLRLWRRTQ